MGSFGDEVCEGAVFAQDDDFVVTDAGEEEAAGGRVVGDVFRKQVLFGQGGEDLTLR